MSVLLIHPPFASPFTPYVSVPTLAAYLRSRNIKVSVWDANNDMLRPLFGHSFIEHAKDDALERLEALNEKKNLGFNECVEYISLVRALIETEKFSREMQVLLDEEAQLSYLQLTQAMRAALHLASCFYCPEIMDFLPPFIIYHSHYDEYTTKAIFENAVSNSLFLDFFNRSLPALLEREQPRIVGISVSFEEQMHAALCCARVIKESQPQTHITVGGSFLSCSMRNLTSPDLFNFIDSIVLDDGEIPLERLLQELSSENTDLDKVPGLLYLREGKIIKNGPSPRVPMSDLPAPDYSLFPMDQYFLPPEQMNLLFRLSRGCSWARCSFCRTDLTMIHCRDEGFPERGVEKLTEIVESTGVRCFNLSDDEASPELLEAFSDQLLKKSLKIRWTAAMRISPGLTPERCRLFSRAGCWLLALGLEAYNNRLLRLLRKGITVDLVDRVLGNMKEGGLKALVFMMVGMPTETEEEAVEGFEKIREFIRQGLVSSYIYSTFQILPDSDIAKNPNRYGIRGMRLFPERDMDYPILDFEGEGMSRKAAFSLERRFTRIMDDTSYINPSVSPAIPRQLTLNGRAISLHFDVEAMRRIMEDGERSPLPYGKWLEEGERTMKPLKSMVPAVMETA